ncbi:MAG: T9SS type A sorting domain-containing protein [Bacteroidetes bacterium]|nr:T9SS type A sorting domain-containing protein [Bacteroidota bacterium]
MKKLFLMSCMVLASHILWAQTLERQVVASAGSYSSNSSGSVSATAGDLVIATSTSGSFMLTQGFQQPDVNPSTGVAKTSEVKADYRLYPSPAKDNIAISIEAAENISVNFYIYNSEGKMVQKLENSLVQGRTYDHNFNITGYSAGTYFFKMTTIEGNMLRTIPFIIQ